MLKIGVVTISNSKDNYGNVLQYLATQEYLNQRGHLTYLLHVKGHKVSFARKFLNCIVETIRNISSSLRPKCKTDDNYLKNEMFKKWARITNKNEKLHPRHFSAFRSENFNIIEGYYEDVLQKNLDVFCVGSDQTWSGVSESFMLGWVPSQYKKISLASSTGHKTFTPENIKAASNYLNSFDLITVREKRGVDMVKQCGRDDVELIMDPTFLLSCTQYNSFASIETIHTTKPYVFVYMLGGEIEMPIHEIIHFCKSKGYDVKYVESQGRDEDEEKEFPTIGGWVALMRDAKYVITNSFHGMAFSLIYEKPFIIFPLIGLMGDMNSRIYDLADKLSVRERVYSGNLDVLFSEINWNKVQEIITLNKEKVNTLLDKIGL